MSHATPREGTPCCNVPRRRSWTCVRLVVASALLLAGCGEGTKRIVILTNGSSPYWDAAAAGAQAAAKELGLEAAGYTLVIDRNNFKVDGQLDKLRQYQGSSDVVAVAVSVTDAQNPAIAEEMKKVQAAGIHVITIDSDVDRQKARDARFAYIGTENLVAGEELGTAARLLLPEGGKYATFVGLKSAANAVERIAGFRQAAGERFTPAEDTLADGGDTDTARKNVKDAMDRNADLALLLGIWSYNTPAIVDMVPAEKRSRLRIIGFDADPPTIQAMQRGMVDAVVVQNPYMMGYLGVKLMRALVEKDQKTIREILPRHGSPDGDLHDTGLKLVIPNEQSPLAADEARGQFRAQVMLLPEFQRWLLERGLTGS